MTKNSIFMKPVTFILGGLVGTSVALLFAPDSGKKTRERISGYASDAKGRIQCYSSGVRDKLTSIAEKTGDYFAEKKSLIAASFDRGKNAYLAEKNRLIKAH